MCIFTCLAIFPTNPTFCSWNKVSLCRPDQTRLEPAVSHPLVLAAWMLGLQVWATTTSSFWVLPIQGTPTAAQSCTQLLLPWAFSTALLLKRRDTRGVIRHFFLFVLAGLLDPQLLDDYLCLEFSEKMKITQGRNAKNSRLWLEYTSEILTVGSIGHWGIKGGRRDISADCSERNSF